MVAIELEGANARHDTGRVAKAVNKTLFSFIVASFVVWVLLVFNFNMSSVLFYQVLVVLQAINQLISHHQIGTRIWYCIYLNNNAIVSYLCCCGYSYRYTQNNTGTW